MANFQTHLIVAAGGVIAASGACLRAGLITPGEAVALALCGLIAGLLPDIDSDHSIPAQWLFRIFSLSAALLTLLLLYDALPLWQLMGSAAIAAAIMRFIVLKVFARITIHRGLFHSLPAAVLAGLLALAITYYLLSFPLQFCWLLAAFITGGYLLHLLLDEFFSINLAGIRLKDSFGTGLTLFSTASWASYLLLYMAVAIAIFVLPLPASFSSLISG